MRSRTSVTFINIITKLAYWPYSESFPSDCDLTMNCKIHFKISLPSAFNFHSIYNYNSALLLYFPVSCYMFCPHGRAPSSCLSYFVPTSSAHFFTFINCSQTHSVCVTVTDWSTFTDIQQTLQFEHRTIIPSHFYFSFSIFSLYFFFPILFPFLSYLNEIKLIY